MNIVFVSVFLFCILAPGFLFRIGYFSPPFSRKFVGSNIINDLSWSIIPAILIHFIAISVVEGYFNNKVILENVGFLLLSVNEKNIVENIFKNIKENLWLILLYNGFLLILSYFSGRLLRLVVRFFKLDRRFPLFRFNNKWHYILSGEILDFPDFPDKFEDCNFKIVDVLCSFGDQKIIYMGKLTLWYLKENGDLDALLLKYPRRRDFTKDEQNNYYKIPSRFLVIPIANVVNINVRYFKVDTPERPNANPIIKSDNG